MAATRAPRSPVAVMLAVWKALFLREALSRMLSERAAWVWLLLEPVGHIAYIAILFMTIRVRVVGGIDTIIWVIVGFLAFFMFRRPAQQGMNAIGSNLPLFTYRQVKPVDTVLVRAGLEGFLMVMVSVVVLGGAGLYGFDIVPTDPLAVLEALLGMWLLGVGFALVASVAVELVPLAGRFIGSIMVPLYITSGIIFPIAATPPPYRDWLVLNPLAHGVDAARLGFAHYYRAIPDLSLAYLYVWALGCIFLGLALHRRYANRFLEQ